MKTRILLIVGISFFCITSFAQAPSWLWVKSAAATGDIGPNSVAVDASGNIYMAGDFDYPTITFGSITLTNNDNSDIFLVKYDVNGNVLWAKTAGGTSQWDDLNSIAVDLSGNVYVVGTFNSAIFTFGSITLTKTSTNGESDDDVFVAKYDSNGNVLWAKSAGGNSWDEAWNVVVDNTSGSVYVIGDFGSPSITFGSYTLTNTTTGCGNFIVKYNSNGNVLWAINSSFEGIALDALGNFYTMSSSNDQSFLCKYDASGNQLWSKNAGGTGYYCDNLVLDVSGNIYMVADFDSPTITFGSIKLTNNGNADILLVKYDANGNILWAKSAGGTGPDYPNSLVVAASGNVYIGGIFDSPSLTFGTTTLSNTGSHIETDDIFLAKYATNGSVLWAKSVGGTDYEEAFIALNASENIYVAGYFHSPSLTFGSITLTNTSIDCDYDGFLAKLGSPNAINEINYLSDINVFPNPASNTISIKAVQHSTIGILNIHGKLILSIPASINSVTTIDISSLPSGIYFAQAVTEKGVVIRKFVKD